MAGPQDANSWFLRNKSFVKPETKDFHSFYCYCLILFARWVMESEVIHHRWKLSSAQPTPCQGICQGFAALDRCSFCHYVTINISMDDTDTEHTLHVDFPVLIPLHSAVCSSSRGPFRKKTVLHPTLLHGEGITVREQAHFQSACNRFSPVTHHGHGIMS